MEFPNIGPIPATDYETMQQYWNSTYGKDMPSVAEILPRADRYADVLLNGTGRFIARVLVIPPTTGQGTTDPGPMFMNVQTNATITTTSVHKTVYKIREPTLFYHLFTYDLGALPARQYVLFPHGR